MPTGPKPRESLDPREERVITWRLPGMLHARLKNVTRKINISFNHFITDAVVEKLHRVEDKLKEKETKKTE